MAAGYNETKRHVLEYLLQNGSATSYEISRYLRLTRAGAASYIRKLYLQGLLGRMRARGSSHERTYYLSDKGANRLDWLERFGLS